MVEQLDLGNSLLRAASKSAVTRLPVGPADSALERAELLAEGEHLGAELRMGAGADVHEVSDEADELIG